MTMNPRPCGRSDEIHRISPAVEPMAVTRLRPCSRNGRTHSRRQIRQIADSIRQFGFTNPVLISDEDEIIAGHGRVEAAKLLGMHSVPTLRLSHLDATQRRAYVIADNKLALNAGWDREVLAIELQALVDIDFDVEITGFSLAEVDLLLDEAREASPDPAGGSEDEVPSLTDPPVGSDPAGGPMAARSASAPVR
jgi:ParB-like chromosome segregation protein Spo0J